MGLEELKEIVAKRRCDRCYKAYLIEELSEDPETKGILVCKNCIDKPGFDMLKREGPKDVYKHYFKH